MNFCHSVMIQTSGRPWSNLVQQLPSQGNLPHLERCLAEEVLLRVAFNLEAMRSATIYEGKIIECQSAWNEADQLLSKREKFETGDLGVQDNIIRDRLRILQKSVASLDDVHVIESFCSRMRFVFILDFEDFQGFRASVFESWYRGDPSYFNARCFLENPFDLIESGLKRSQKYGSQLKDCSSDALPDLPARNLAADAVFDQVVRSIMKVRDGPGYLRLAESRAYNPASNDPAVRAYALCVFNEAMSTMARRLCDSLTGFGLKAI